MRAGGSAARVASGDAPRRVSIGASGVGGCVHRRIMVSFTMPFTYNMLFAFGGDFCGSRHVTSNN